MDVALVESTKNVNGVFAEVVKSLELSSNDSPIKRVSLVGLEKTVVLVMLLLILRLSLPATTPK